MRISFRKLTGFSFDCALLPLSKLPEFFARTDYKNPQDGFDCPFQYGHDTDQFFFDWIAERPELLASFSNHMAGYRQGRPSWMDVDFFPVEELLKGLDLTETSPLLVDVGGGIGHDVEEFKAKFPGLRGRLIVQDLPGPIAAAQKSPGIELMAHDFFTPQPVQGGFFQSHVLDV